MHQYGYCTCSAMDWHTILGVFLAHARFSQDRLRIHVKPDQDEMLTEDEDAWLYFELKSTSYSTT